MNYSMHKSGVFAKIAEKCVCGFFRKSGQELSPIFADAKLAPN